MFNLLNTLSISVSNIYMSKTIEMLNISLASTILTLLVITSLVLTFYSNGTTVHKVLGLLLVSIFVVFLWVLQTQFLFIYIVYIMAFISAVLMLFLSVVLMLPISTLTSTHKLTDSKNSYNVIWLFLAQPVHNSDLASVLMNLSNVIIFLFFLLVIFFITNKYLKKNLNKVLYPFTNNKELVKFLTGRGDFVMVDFAYFKAEWFLRLLSSVGVNKSLTESILYFYSMSLLRDHKPRHILTHILFWFLAFILMFLSFIFNKIVVSPRSYLKVLFTLYNINIKHVSEVMIQSYLYLSILIYMISLLTIKQDWFANIVNLLDFDDSLGLSQIKTLLYGDYSYFLIFSTVVLLVALLGAAVMTRSKR